MGRVSARCTCHQPTPLAERLRLQAGATGAALYWPECLFYTKSAIAGFDTLHCFPAPSRRIIAVLGHSCTHEVVVVDDPNMNQRRSFQTAGQRLDDFLGDASQRIEKETQELIAYINDELVPAIRSGSSKAMRVASEKLTQAADTIERNTPKRKG